MLDFKRISDYCEKHSTPPDDVLRDLERETNLKTLSPQMVTGHLQGQMLSLISRWIKPNAILEIGTFTGYGTICLSKGLSRNGVIHTIEVNPELSYIANKYFQKANISNKVRHYIGDAKDIIPTINEEFDLIYIDAGKQEYELHYYLSIDKMKKGGVILVDNTLWSGKVGTGVKDKDTQILESFNNMVFQDERVENLLLPIRDGLMIIIKK